MTFFGIDPATIATIVATWRREGDALSALDYGSSVNGATDSFALAALGEFRTAAHAATQPQGRVLAGLGDALAKFNALTADSDRSSAVALSASPE